MWRFTTGRDRLKVMLLIALAAVTVRVAAGDEPLTNVDIVRMTAARIPSGEIIRAIRSAPSTRFDLDPEIVSELVRAGVASDVIEAMKRTQPAPPPPPVSPPAAPEASLEIAFSRQAVEGKKPGIIISDTDREGRKTSLAFFVICVDPTHVPDSWAARSALGGRFPRHEVLWFHEAIRPLEDSKRLSLIDIDVPDRHTIVLPAGRHVLEIGVAARADGLDWVPLASATARVEASTERGLEILVRLQSESIGLEEALAGRPPSYECEILGIRQAGPVKVRTP